MTRTLPAALAACLLTALFAVSCGGGGGTSTDTPEAYVQAFCEAIGGHTDLFEQLGALDTSGAVDDAAAIESLQDAVDIVAPGLSGLSDDLNDIDPPGEIAQQHEDMVAAFAASADTMEQAGELFDQPLSEAVAGLDEFQTSADQIGQSFDGIGDFPAEYQQAAQDEEACQALEDAFNSL